MIIGCGSNEKAAAPAASESAKPAAPLPDANSARQLIESSAEWSDFQFTYASTSLPLRAKEMNEAHKKTVQELRAAGWLGVDGDGNAILTEKAKSDRRFLVRPNLSVDIVPLAKKEIQSVSAPTKRADGNAEVTIDWRWIPNEVGAALQSGLAKQIFDAPHQAKATLMPVENGWSVLLITPSS